MSTLNIEWKPKPIFTQDWFSSRIPALTEWLKHYKDKPCYAIEIGCFEGRSTLWFLENILTHKDSVIIAVDTFKGSEEHTQEQVEGLYERFENNLSGYLDKKCFVKEETSEEFFEKHFILNPNGTDGADFAYIDGSHKAEDVYKDAIGCWEVLNLGGILIFDDYLWKEKEDRPKAGIDKFIFEKWDEIEVINKGYCVFVVKGEKNVN
jgi:predicted O-methyltransferase YrrM